MEATCPIADANRVAEIVSDGGGFFPGGRGASARVRLPRKLFDNHIGSFSGGANTGGTWTGASHDSANDVTELQHIGETFDAYMQGWSVQIDARLPVYFEITGVSGNTITVAGNVTGLVDPDETEFTIIHPPGVDPQTGATQTDPCTPESRYIWGGGLYLPPIAGFYSGGTTQGSQPGHNMAGQHYMWNRVYDINMGRWTTPDPAMSPWWNGFSYTGESPLSQNDPSGLHSTGTSVRTETLRALYLEMLRSGQTTRILEALAVGGIYGVAANRALEDRIREVKRSKEKARYDPKPAPKPQPRPDKRPIPVSAAAAAAAAAAVTGSGRTHCPKRVGGDRSPPPRPPDSPGPRNPDPDDKDRCKRIHEEYTKYKGKCSCKGQVSAAEAMSAYICFMQEFALRTMYLALDCDYLLEGSIKKGSKTARDGHVTQAAEKFTAAQKCLGKYHAIVAR